MDQDIERKPITVNGNGLMGNWVSLGAILAERSVGLGFGLARDLQIELSATLENGLVFADTNQQTSMRLLRKALRRLTSYGLDITDVSEQAVLTTVHTVRGAGHDAIELASKTASAMATPARSTPRAVA